MQLLQQDNSGYPQQFLLMITGSPANRAPWHAKSNPSGLDSILLTHMSRAQLAQDPPHKITVTALDRLSYPYNLQMVCKNAQINETLGNLLMFWVGCSRENMNIARQGSNRSCCNVKSLQLKICSISMTKHHSTALMSSTNQDSILRYIGQKVFKCQNALFTLSTSIHKKRKFMKKVTVMRYRKQFFYLPIIIGGHGKFQIVAFFFWSKELFTSSKLSFQPLFASGPLSCMNP